MTGQRHGSDDFQGGRTFHCVAFPLYRATSPALFTPPTLERRRLSAALTCFHSGHCRRRPTNGRIGLSCGCGFPACLTSCTVTRHDFVFSTEQRADPGRQHCAQWSVDARGIWDALCHWAHRLSVVVLRSSPGVNAAVRCGRGRDCAWLRFWARNFICDVAALHCLLTGGLPIAGAPLGGVVCSTVFQVRQRHAECATQPSVLLGEPRQLRNRLVCRVVSQQRDS